MPTTLKPRNASGSDASDGGVSGHDDSSAPDRTTQPPSRGNGGSLTKVTVNLIPRAVHALDEVSGTTGETKTESINRAIQLYAWVHKMLDEGESVQVVSTDGTVRVIQIF